MTEMEWVQSNDPTPMLDFLRDRTSPRKLRLFAVACCRRIWPLITDNRSREAVETAGREADHQTFADELRQAAEAAYRAYSNALTRNDNASYAALASTNRNPLEAAYMASRHARTASLLEAAKPNEREGEVQASLLRHLMGNPFRPRSVDQDWLRWNHGAVIQIAKSIDRNRNSSAMSLLGDALEDAGCRVSDILLHCREEGEHPRGCWVLDLLLGKD